MSQPAITQALAKLEQGLGTTLFERRSDGMDLTDQGRLFLARVERAIDLVQLGARDAIRLAPRNGMRGFANFDRLVTTSQMRALIAVSGAGNFTLAARAAEISQPTLHRSARDLERLSGLVLFTKTATGIELTASAKPLVQAVKLAFSELDQGSTEIKEMLGTDQGQILVGTLPLPRTFILPTAINALVADRPEVRINVVDGPYDDLLHALRSGDLDILVGALRRPLPIDDIVQEALFSDSLAVIGRAGHPLAGMGKVRRQQLASYPWAVPRKGTPTRKYFDQIFADLAMPGNIVESSSLVLIRGLLLNSDRLTLISAHQVRHEREMGLLAALPVALPEISRPIGITHRRDWRPTATQKAFLERLRDAGRQAQSE